LTVTGKGGGFSRRTVKVAWVTPVSPSVTLTSSMTAALRHLGLGQVGLGGVEVIGLVVATLSADSKDAPGKRASTHQTVPAGGH
jgi:succinyl-CoA synthetase alpha subunit